MKTELKNIGTWGRLHYDFLYRNQRSVINAMRLKGTLNDYIKVLAVFERIGEVLATCCALVFSDFNLRAWSLWSLWLVASFVLMIMYEFWWIRYFRSERRLSDFYSSFCGVPLAGATLPVLAFFLLGIYGKVIWMLIACVILGIGHIGIHWQHSKEL